MRCSNSLTLAVLALALPAAAHAQAYQCRVPQVTSVPKITPDGPRRQNAITGYTLALSWSPEFCRTRTDDPAHAVQCSGENGSFGLVARQWAKHGSCMVKRPANYLKIIAVLRSGLRLPEYDRISREENLTAGRIRAAFADANPGWSEEAIGIELSPRGWLEEIRLCYSRRFRPAPCPASRRGAKDTVPAKIWRGL
ncbi:MAG: ribonuclease T [Porphyrobacter sp.]|nr:ribonuclease T [Porphyrobacter sp.]